MTDEFNKKYEKLVIVDGNHLIHRAFHAIQAPLKTSSGEQTNALFGFASMTLNIIDLERPDYMVVAFDERAPTFRHEAHEGYKATRAKAPDELYAQIPRIREMLKRFKIPIFSKEGFEADDVMGTLAKQAESQGIKTYLVTGDRDVLQLITPLIFVVFPHKGYREPIRFDAQKVFEKYGIRPDQIVDYKALMGDVSDNFKGVEGIGSKRASDLLSKYQTLEGIYEHLWEIPETIRVKLASGHDDALFSRSLAQIVTNVPCSFNKEEAAFFAFDFEGLSHFFKELEIHSLQRRLEKIVPREVLRPDKNQLSFF
ncbi:hypothetical protein HZA43_02815 [Candidatus Peregrinibacteria bacterium]|nr:hypothetical protein [Candidatus Peregrinibacteria bacterium]